MTSADRIPVPPSYVGKLGTAFACVALILAASCSRETPAATNPPPPEVRVITVASQTLANIIEVPSRWAAARSSRGEIERTVADVELLTARNLGVRLARVASALKIVRVTTTQRQVDVPAYVTRGE